MNLGLTRLAAGRAFYYLALVLNILGLIVGIVMCFSPLFSVLALAYMVGFYLILLGIDGTVMAVSNFTRR